MQKIDLPIEKEEKDKISPLKPDFKWVWKMIFTIILIIFIIYFWVWAFSKYVILNISIEKEKEIFWNLFIEDTEKTLDKSIFWENIWELKNFNIYISEEEAPNAFATPWANIIVTKWLLKEAKTKEEILFILGHEMTHIKNRDVLKNFTKNMPFTIILNFLWIDFWTWVFNTNTLISNYFSREAEKNADSWAIEFMNSLELNATCAERFFKEIWWNDRKILEFAQSHPVNWDRVKFIEKNSKFKNKKCEKFEWK